MKFTARQIATLLGGTIEGDENVTVVTIAKIQEAEADCLAFFANPRYESSVYTTKAGILLVNTDFVPKQEVNSTLIRVPDSYLAFTSLLEYAQAVLLALKVGVEQPSFVGDNAKLGDNCYLGAFSYIGANVKIGDNVKIYPQTFIGDNSVIGNNTIIYAGVKLYAGTKIGEHSVIHSGAVIGSDGFGFALQPDGSYKAIPQLGNVEIGDFVSIGANTTIDRATLGSTVIKNGVKLDNLIQIAHNVLIDDNTVIAAQTGIAGSAIIGKNCLLGGQVGIVGHITIADGTKIQAQSGVNYSTENNAVLQGSPADDRSKYVRNLVAFRQLAEMLSRLNKIEKQLKGFENNP